jgi:molybdenum cofactor cytidylyltransferase
METNTPSSALILLAAGASSRMGAPKQLLDFHGKPMLRHVTEVALAAGCSPVIVVLGAREEAIRPALLGLDVEIALNPRWTEGMGTSIQAGLCALGDREVAGTILALADQPFVPSSFLRSLLEKHRESGRGIVAAQYADTVGVPAFFARAAFPLLRALPPEQGCKVVILESLAETFLVDCPDAARDIDTPDDYRTLLANPSDPERHPLTEPGADMPNWSWK